jgi:hypothetical protein
MQLVRVCRDGCCGSVVGEEAAMELRKLSLQLREMALARKHPSQLEVGATRARLG